MLEKVRELVVSQDMRRALLIDDVYDPPVVLDIRHRVQAFIDCLKNDEDYEIVCNVLGEDDLDEDMLLERLEDREVVRKIHETPKKSLPTGAWDAIFAEYEDVQSTKKAEIDAIVQLLENIGCEVFTCGRESQICTQDFEILFVDLFFRGSFNAEEAADDAAQVVAPYLPDAEVLSQHTPLIVLISSRVTELNQVYERFRDRAQVPGCRFRYMAKRLFRENSNEALFQLHQLFEHNPVSQQFDHFVREMNVATQHAKSEFIKTLRRFELSDYVDLKDLIVSIEGVSLKHYLMELFSFAWGSLAESNTGLIEALDKLNEFDLSVTKYPPNSFVPSEAVSELYERALYRPSIALGNLQSFSDLRLGDILQSTSPTNGLPELFLIIVQDCDMLRDGEPAAAFLISGIVFDRKAERTGRAITFPYSISNQRLIVKWDLKKWSALCKANFAAFLEDRNLKREMRIRTPWSLSLQSQFFQHLMRPAELAAPHNISRVLIQVLIKDDRKTARVAIDFADDTEAFILHRRTVESERARLVLSDGTARRLRDVLRECLTEERKCACDTRKNIQDLISDATKLDLLRANLSVKIKNIQCEQESPLNWIATAWGSEKHWVPDRPAGKFDVMINIQSAKEPNEES